MESANDQSELTENPLQIDFTLFTLYSIRKKMTHKLC